ncbi:hypothetical protein N0V90_007471 [Kalmusia sp. IMI 367209]|nr:hypothetical protein N0V90_007471 [Kalmusia sp. IMI 367209]
MANPQRISLRDCFEGAIAVEDIFQQLSTRNDYAKPESLYEMPNGKNSAKRRRAYDQDLDDYFIVNSAQKKHVSHNKGQQSPSSLSTAKLDLLRAEVFEKILQVQQENLSPINSEESDSLKDIVDHLHTAKGENQYDSAPDAYYVWIQMHYRLDEFRSKTGYRGSSDSWEDHVNDLDNFAAENHARSHAIRMHKWWCKTKIERPWNDDGFNQELAVFFERLVDARYCIVTFLARGFE